jgi:hypothetical protein
MDPSKENSLDFASGTSPREIGMDEPSSRNELLADIKNPTNWQFRFVQEKENFKTNLITMIFFLGFTGFAIIIGCYIIIIGEGLTGLGFFFASVAIGIYAMMYLPWHPVIIEKNGIQLKIRIKGAVGGIISISTRIDITHLKSWYYSDKTMLLGFEVPFSDPFRQVESKKKGIAWERIILKGIKPTDLSFLLDWLGSNYKRNSLMDDN